jgi:hypothetical protein
VSSVCREVRREEEEEGDGEHLSVVGLHGLTETDDRIALREIAKQLKLENVVKDRVSEALYQYWCRIRVEIIVGGMSELRGGPSTLSAKKVVPPPTLSRKFL